VDIHAAQFIPGGAGFVLGVIPRKSRMVLVILDRQARLNFVEFLTQVFVKTFVTCAARRRVMLVGMARLR
jgi:hypothetical protein